MPNCARWEERCHILQLPDAGELPLRVAQNDTRTNDVRKDSQTDEALCVIDLDTVMPGTLLWDLGDAIRFGASTAPEDGPDISKISLNMEYFAVLAEDLFAGPGGHVTPLEPLPLSVTVMTGELAARFLTDYLNGNTDFKINYPERNLVRSRVQLALHKDVLARQSEMIEAMREKMCGANCEEQRFCTMIAVEMMRPSSKKCSGEGRFVGASWKVVG